MDINSTKIDRLFKSPETTTTEETSVSFAVAEYLEEIETGFTKVERDFFSEVEA